MCTRELLRNVVAKTAFLGSVRSVCVFTNYCFENDVGFCSVLVINLVIEICFLVNIKSFHSSLPLFVLNRTFMTFSIGPVECLLSSKCWAILDLLLPYS